jgi:hypothetical protein
MPDPLIIEKYLQGSKRDSFDDQIPHKLHILNYYKSWCYVNLVIKINLKVKYFRNI